MEGWFATALGIVAGLCTSSSFVPQVVKAWREADTEAISMRMYLVGVAAYALWVVHGLMIWSVPIILFNVLNLVFAGIILALKLRSGTRAESN
jgi:MtN3 and saliva related transmembrane protein